MIRKRLTWLAQRLRDDAVPPPWLLQSLVTCWMNQWSVDSNFLAGMLRWYGKTSGPVLECGSGLTTLVLATAAWTKAAAGCGPALRTCYPGHPATRSNNEASGM